MRSRSSRPTARPSASTIMRARAKERGLKLIIAGAGGAAHLPGMAASMTSLPVLGVPVESKALKGMDSLLSIVQMPAGVPVGTLAIGQAGRGQCRLARRRDPRPSTTKRSPAGSTAYRAAQTEVGRRTAPNDRSAGLHHRHRRRRPARPDAGHRRGPARLRMPHLRPARSALRRRRRRRPSRARHSTMARRSRDSPRRSTSSPMSSRICRSSRLPRSATSCARARARWPVAQDRAVEKQFIESVGGRVAPWRTVDGPDDVEAAIDALGLPLVLKTRRFGYDGKGQAWVRDRERGARGLGRRSAEQPAVAEAGDRFRRRIFGAARADRQTATPPSGTAPRNVHRRRHPAPIRPFPRAT